MWIFGEYFSKAGRMFRLRTLGTSSGYPPLLPGKGTTLVGKLMGKISRGELFY
jgi:hypothetical protein